MKNEKLLSSPRLRELKRKRKKAFATKITLVAVCVLVLIVGLALVSRIGKLQLSNVEISGNKVVESKALEDSIRNEISGKYLWLFPKSNFILYPKSKIKENLAVNFKRLKDVSVSTKNPTTLQVNLSEREGKYTWCGGEPNVEAEKCYFLDESGYIFDEAPYFSGSVYFKFYGKKGDYFAPGNWAKFMGFKENLEKMGIKPTSLYMKDDGDSEVYLGLSGKPKILIKTDSDLNKMAENLQAALSTQPLQNDFVKKYSSLEYIDLRFGNKVYYKFQ
ncbi:MAG TPA: FtsQ-type POTRA domain-containing protein [Candidatus Paceibacterota bacterium]